MAAFESTALPDDIQHRKVRRRRRAVIRERPAQATWQRRIPCVSFADHAGQRNAA